MQHPVRGDRQPARGWFFTSTPTLSAQRATSSCCKGESGGLGDGGELPSLSWWAPPTLVRRRWLMQVADLWVWPVAGLSMFTQVQECLQTHTEESTLTQKTVRSRGFGEGRASCGENVLCSARQGHSLHSTGLFYSLSSLFPCSFFPCSF